MQNEIKLTMNFLILSSFIFSLESCKIETLPEKKGVEGLITLWRRLKIIAFTMNYLPLFTGNYHSIYCRIYS